MMRNRQIGAGILVLVAAALAAMYLLPKQPSAPPMDVVRSADGSAELHIPAGALPEGTALSSISVTRAEPSAEGQLASYTLSPDGLQFAKPIEVVVRVPFPAQPSTNDTTVPVPTLVLMSGDGKQLENVASSTDVDMDAQDVVATAQIAHFSTLNVLSFVSARIDNPSDHQLGEQFFVGARLSQDRKQIRVPIEGDEDVVAYVHEMNTWYLQSGEFTSKTEATAPEEIRDAPKATTPGEGTRNRLNYQVVRAFTCMYPGEAAVTYRVHSDGNFIHFTEDPDGSQTSYEVPNEDLSAPLRVTTRTFRCLGSDDTIVTDPDREKQVVDRTHAVVSLRYGRIETTITPSTTRLNVGETVTVDAVLTDTTDQLLSGLAPKIAQQYHIGWNANGTWTAAPIFDRTEVDVIESHRTAYGGRVTFRLPLKCVSPGKGTVRFDSFVGRTLEIDGLNPQLPTYSGATIETAPIECVGPATVQEPQTEPVKLQVSPTVLQQAHNIGSTACPQKIGTVTISGPAGGKWTATNIPKWIQMPSSGTFGKVNVSFNCRISDYTSHTESAAITISSGEQTAKLNVEVDVKK